VQAFAVELLHVLDVRDDVNRKVWDLRSRIAGAHPEEMQRIFPEWFPEEKREEEKPKPEEDKDIVWRIPDSQSEVDDIDAWVRQHQQLSVTSDEMREWQ